MAEETRIEIWASSTEEDMRAAFPSFRKTPIQITSVEPSVLANNLKEVLAAFQQILDAQPNPSSGYCVEEIELSLGVNGIGGFALIGKVEAGMQASVKVKLKKR